MALQDFTYRLKAVNGDTTPVDVVGGSITLAGGTITLVDMGGSDYAWQFVGKASADGPSKTVTGTTAGTGVTIALRIAVTSYDAAGFAYLAGYGDDSTPAKGLVLGQNGTNIIRSRWVDSGTDTLSMLTVNTAIRTVVIRATINSGVTDKVHSWVNGVTGSADTADYISTGQNYTSPILDTVFLGSAGSTIRVSDFVVWGEELSDANCHTLAESGIRATLDVTPSVDATISWTEPADISAIAGDVAISAVTVDVAWTEAADVTAIAALAEVSGAMSWTEAADAAAIAATFTPNTPTITIADIKLNNGTLRASETFDAYIYNLTTGALVVKLAAQVSTAGGDLELVSASMTAAVEYRVVLVDSGGLAGVGRATAA
jgi:hypothetical protein